MTNTRRDVLRLGGAAIATAGSLAGCTGNGETGTTDESDPNDASATDAPSTPTEGETRTKTGSPTDSETLTEAAETDGSPATSDVARWLPAPAAVGLDGYAIRSLVPSALYELRDEFGDGAVDEFAFESAFACFDRFADVTGLHALARGITVIEGDVDRNAVERDIADGTYADDGAYRGYSVFSTGDGQVVAVGDEALVLTQQFASDDERDRRTVVDAVIDAVSGEAARYRDASEDCGRVLDAIGDGHLVSGQFREAETAVDGATAEGLAIRYGSDETSVDAAAVFADEDTDERAVAEWAGGRDAFYGQAAPTSTDGRTVTASAALPTEDVTSIPVVFPDLVIRRQTRQSTPQTAFNFDYESEGDDVGILTVTHVSGDSIPATELFLRGTGFRDAEGVDQTAAGPWQGTTSRDEETVLAGDRATVGVKSDYEISVVWIASDGEKSATLAEAMGPDA